MLQFEHEKYLWLLTAVPFIIILFLLVLNWKSRMIRRLGDEKMVRLLIRNYSLRLFSYKFILLAVAYALGVLALVNLRKPVGLENISRKGIDLVIALDVSKSRIW